MNKLTIFDAFPPWLAQTKILPLRQNTSLIERHELNRILNSGTKKVLSLIVAPAGFGKSTLLGHWRHELLKSDHHVAWLNIDEDDNDPSILALYLAYSFASAGLADDIFNLYSSGFDTETSLRTLLGVLLSVITKQDKKVFLMLDDMEKLDKIVIKKLIEPLLRYSPDKLHIVMAARTAENLPLSSLKLQGQVNEITTTDLKFTSFEIESFLDKQLDKKTLQKVINKTEGWPVALQLIRNAISRHRDYKKVINRFKGTEQDTRDYIFEQILNNLPGYQRHLLLDVSILKQFDPETVDLIRDTENSTAVLKELEGLDNLVCPIENREQLYRLHPLIREALIYYQAQSNPERMKSLHLKAADMFMKQGHLIQAIRHALNANDPETAATILEQAGGILLWNREGMSRIRKAHALLPMEIINTHPRLSLLKALIFLKDGHINDARHIYEKVRQEVKNNSHPYSIELEYDLAVITSTLTIYEGTPFTEELSYQLLSYIEKFETIDKLQIGFVYTVLCIFNVQKGNFPEARKVGDKAITHFQKHNSVFGATYIYLHLGIVAIAEGDLDLAMDYYKKVQSNIRRFFIDDKDLKLVFNILMAEWHYEKNELNTAERLLGDINQRLETGEAWYEIYAAGYSTSAALAYLQKGLGACVNLSESATTYIRQEGLKRLNRLVVANKVGYLCRAGKIAKAREVVQENNLTFLDYNIEKGVHFTDRECYGVVQSLSRLLIAEKRYDEAIAELQTQIKCHQTSFETRAIHKFHLLLSIALFESGEEESAFQKLDMVLLFIRTRGFLRFALDEEPFIVPLLEAYAETPLASEKDHAKYLLNQLNDIKLTQAAIILSHREEQVLNQLADGYADKLIARNLDISENTVRFHLKNIFQKMGVNSRLMAVSEATKHKLL